MHQLKGIGVNNRRVGIADIILLLLTVVLPDSFAQIVHGISFLPQGVALILLVAENTFYRADRPDCFPGGRGDLTLGQT